MQNMCKLQINARKDVVFLGDSITQHWMDRKGNRHVFNKFFNKEEGEFDGLALGIFGDTVPHLLWRLQNGEMPPNLQSKVYWILIGTNDFGDGCSDEIVFIGIRRIIEELRMTRPNSIIVINSILPRSNRVSNGAGKPLGMSPYKIWNAIQIVNSKLREYCKRQHKQNIFYLDATDIFLREDNDNHTYVAKELMPDLLHPNAAGYQTWAELIVKTLHSLEPVFASYE